MYDQHGVPCQRDMLWVTLPDYRVLPSLRQLPLPAGLLTYFDTTIVGVWCWSSRSAQFYANQWRHNRRTVLGLPGVVHA